MNLIKKNIWLILAITAIFLPYQASAVCPVCTIAVGAGIGLSRWLGVDDGITGIWVGGLIISLIIWFLTWLDKKNIHFKLRNFVIYLVFYFFFIASFYGMGLMGHPLNRLCGMDKLLFGIILGGLVFLISVGLNNLLKKKNHGKVFFPYQKVVIPVVLLLIASLVYYWITKCYK